MSDANKDILAVNEAFYQTFAAGNFAALSALWSKSEAISVIHPGSGALHGQNAVMNSWRQILENSGGSDIQCANATVYLHGNSAYVVCHEIFPQGSLVATNIFVREEGLWRMIHHQAGPDNQEIHKDVNFSNSLH